MLGASLLVRYACVNNSNQSIKHGNKREVFTFQHVMKMYNGNTYGHNLRWSRN
jgi:hypothetical protein